MSHAGRDPWIPVTDGARLWQVGIREALTNPAIARITAGPLETVAILALLVRIDASGDVDGWLAAHDADLDHTRLGQDPGLRLAKERPRPLGENPVLGMDTDGLSWDEALRLILATDAWDATGIRGGAVDDPETSRGRRYPAGFGWAAPGVVMLQECDTLLDTITANTPADPQDLAPLRRRIRGTWDGETCTEMAITYPPGPDTPRPGSWGVRSQSGTPLIWSSGRPVWAAAAQLVAGRPAHLPESGVFRLIGVRYGPKGATIEDAIDERLSIGSSVMLSDAQQRLDRATDALRSLGRNLLRGEGAYPVTIGPDRWAAIVEAMDGPARAVLVGQLPDWSPVYRHVDAVVSASLAARRGRSRYPEAEQAEGWALTELREVLGR